MIKSKRLLTEGRIIDWVIIFIMAKKFITPFRKWAAFDLGIIDEKGKRTNKKIVTLEEKNAYTPLDRMIRKIRVFVGDRWFLKLTLAFLLFKEDVEYHKVDKLLLESEGSIVKTVAIGALEGITLSYSNSIFTIQSTLRNPETGEEIVTSKFEYSKFPNKKEYLGFLNSIFGNILTSGYKEYIIDNDFKITISYGPKELKIESPENKFYVLFNNRKEVVDLMDKWEELYSEIIYR